MPANENQPPLVERIVTVLAADDNFSRPLAATVQSLVSHLSPGREVSLYLCDMGIAESNRRIIEAAASHGAVSVHWVPMAAQVEHLPPSTFARISRAAYARLFIPTVLPVGTKRALYLDCDLIVRRCIGDLFDTPIGESVALAVPDAASPFASSPYGVPYWAQYGRRADELNFNSGVLLMDVARWQNEDVAGLAVAYLNSERHQGMADQEAINAVLPGRIGQLDPRWNQQTEHHDPVFQATLPYSEAWLQAIVGDPWIVHYTTHIKAWTYGSRHPFRDDWFTALDATGYRGWRPKRPGYVGRISRRVRAGLKLRTSV